MLLRLLIGAGLLLIGWFIFSQLIVPAFTDKPSFSLFRRTSKKKELVKEEIRELHSQGELTALEKKAAAIKKKQQNKGPGPQEKEKI